MTEPGLSRGNTMGILTQLIATASTYSLMVGIPSALDNIPIAGLNAVLGLLIAPIVGSVAKAVYKSTIQRTRADLRTLGLTEGEINNVEGFLNDSNMVFKNEGIDGLIGFIRSQVGIRLTENTANTMIETIQSEQTAAMEELDRVTEEADTAETRGDEILRLGAQSSQKRFSDIPKTAIEALGYRASSSPLRVSRLTQQVPVEPSDTAIEIENPMRIGTGARTLTNRLKFLKKHGLPADTSLSLKEMSKLSGFPIQALTAVKRRGVGAWKTSIGSVRMKDGSKNPSAPRTSKMSKEQWSLGRVFAFLMKTKKVFYKADNDIREKYGLK